MDCHSEEQHSVAYGAVTSPRLISPPEEARFPRLYCFFRISETALRTLFGVEASGFARLYQLSMAPKLLKFGEDVCGFAFRSIEKQILARVSNFWYLLPNKRE